jgi:hypothetical protein
MEMKGEEEEKEEEKAELDEEKKDKEGRRMRRKKRRRRKRRRRMEKKEEKEVITQEYLLCSYLHILIFSLNSREATGRIRTRRATLNDVHSFIIYDVLLLNDGTDAVFRNVLRCLLIRCSYQIPICVPICTYLY